ncbi:hypothetical protein NMG60_11006471 [Bertholletia excelsa]
MTVKDRMSDSRDQKNPGSHLGNSAEFFSLDEEKKKSYGREADRSTWGKSMTCAAEVETDLESIGSSEEMESPRPVAKLIHVHSQILRIREEDSHLGEDCLDSLSTKDKFAGYHHRLYSSHVDVMLFSRPILPASPLSGKPAIKTVH